MRTLAFEQPRLITEEQLFSPVIEILDNVLPTDKNTKTLDNPNPSIKQTLDTLFPEQLHEGKQIQKAKVALGKISSEFTEAQLRDIVSEVQFLADCWLDNFERTLFDGLTLMELLHEKGGK